MGLVLAHTIVAAVMAQPAPNAGDPARVLVLIGVVIAVTVVAGLVVVWLRRRVLGSTPSGSGETFMESLRRMRDRGEISAEEFEKARRSLLDRVTSRGRGGSASR